MRERGCSRRYRVVVHVLMQFFYGFTAVRDCTVSRASYGIHGADTERVSARDATVCATLRTCLYYVYTVADGKKHSRSRPARAAARSATHGLTGAGVG